MKDQDKKKKELNEQEDIIKETEGVDGAVGKLEQKIEECETKYKRALADYQNLEKRVQSERHEWIRSANKDIIYRFLPLADTLELAMRHSEDQTLKVTYQQFLDILKQEGVEKIQTQGKSFDPHTMECIQTEEGEKGKVLQELRSGYTLYGIVLRPAQVTVGKQE